MDDAIRIHKDSIDDPWHLDKQAVEGADNTPIIKDPPASPGYVKPTIAPPELAR